VGLIALTARAAPVSTVPVDAERFGRVYREHVRSVWRMLRRLGLDEATTDDATQDVFVTAHRRWHEFEGRSSMRTWLLGIALRVATEHRRKARRMEPISLELPSLTPSPHDAAERHQQVEHLMALMQGLPVELRELLVLVELEGYSVPEVSEATGVNLNTLYTRLRAARSRFEALLEGAR
jgi:RNA polymerase sigma-70 factor (ECF subfamily)